MSTEFLPFVSDDDEQDSLNELEAGLDIVEAVNPIDELITEVAESNIDVIRHGRKGEQYQFLTLIDTETFEKRQELSHPLDEVNRAMLERVYAEVLSEEAPEARIDSKQSEDIAEHNVFRTDRFGDDICEHLLVLGEQQICRVSVIFPIRTWHPADRRSWI